MQPTTQLLAALTIVITTGFGAGCGATEGHAHLHQRGAPRLPVSESGISPATRPAPHEPSSPLLALDVLHDVSLVQVEASRFSWLSLGGLHWQIASSEREPHAVTDAREGNRGTCAKGMVHVTGQMKLDAPNALPVGKQQLTVCTQWLSRGYPERCQTFDRAAWVALSSALPSKSMDYCIDRFEYPNIKGQFPAVFASATEAADRCESEGKRLCDEDEWTFACEGEEAAPYAYGTGYERDPDACVADRAWMPFDPAAMVIRDSERAAFELDRVWQGKASGSQPQCRSRSGVYDMVGNVDEWTTSTREHGKPSILKGGFWGPVRARCRPSTRSHGDHHKYYQQGFRCCSAARGSVAFAHAP